MSYRSEVGIRLECPIGYTVDQALAQLNTLMRDTGDEYFTCAKDLFDIVEERDGALILKAQSVKWYESYAEVQAVNTWLEEMGNLIDQRDSGGYHFVRIGEETEDIEQDYRGDLEQPINVYVSMDI